MPKIPFIPLKNQKFKPKIPIAPKILNIYLIKFRIFC